jgi:hypothetical protein
MPARKKVLGRFSRSLSIIWSHDIDEWMID